MSTQTQAQREIVDLMRDGFVIVQAITNEDREAGFYLKGQQTVGTHAYKERVPARTARAIISRPDVQLSVSSTWKVWSIKMERGNAK